MTYGVGFQVGALGCTTCAIKCMFVFNHVLVLRVTRGPIGMMRL